MSAVPLLPRLAVLAATGATTLCIGALSVPTARAQGDVVFGSVASVSGNTLEVAQPNGSATVSLTDATKVSEAVQAGRGEITVGSCITAGPTPDSAPADGGAITAKWVLISTAVDGKCPHRDGSGPTPPAEPAHHYGVRGVVDSIAGDTVNVTRTDAAGATSPASVTLTDATHYKRRVPATAAAITQGSCVAARGSRDGSGVLQATRVTFWPSPEGQCPQPVG
ncbi:MAG TPA: DUF5666 domain-containing protein [Mycobacterium sp.]|nr:DUF5666 domain-containing protein [Mycobacterium sp.]